MLASGSYARSLPGLEIDGERVLTSDHALGPRPGAGLGGRARRRRDRLRVRQRVALLRRRGDHRRGAPPARSRRRTRPRRSSSQRAFRKRKIKALTGTPFKGVDRTESGVRLTVENGDPLEAELLLVAVGRGPRTEGLGYDEQGIAMDRGFVLADERCRTNLPSVFAVGDIVPGLQLAHRGFAQGIFVAEEIAGLDPTPVARSRASRGSPTATPRSPRSG